MLSWALPWNQCLKPTKLHSSSKLQLTDPNNHTQNSQLLCPNPTIPISKTKEKVQSGNPINSPKIHSTKTLTRLPNTLLMNYWIIPNTRLMNYETYQFQIKDLDLFARRISLFLFRIWVKLLSRYWPLHFQAYFFIPFGFQFWSQIPFDSLSTIFKIRFIS